MISTVPGLGKVATTQFTKFKRSVKAIMPKSAASRAFHDCRLLEERRFSDPGLRHLEASRRDVTSQNGEDGVISALFEAIGAGSRTAVEFGAWDGKHYSNTWNLLENEQWHGVK